MRGTGSESFLTPATGGGMVYNASNNMTQFTATGVPEVIKIVFSRTP